MFWFWLVLKTDPLQFEQFPPNERTFGVLVKSLIQVRGLVIGKQMTVGDSWDAPLKVVVLELAAFIEFFCHILLQACLLPLAPKPEPSTGPGCSAILPPCTLTAFIYKTGI